MTTSARQSDYKYHEQYYSINTGAHRKGGVELTTPTLTHHIGLWFPKVPDDAETSRTVRRFGVRVDRAIWQIYQSLRHSVGFECNFEFDVEARKLIGIFGAAYDPDGSMGAPIELTPAPSHLALKDALESDNKILFMKARWQGLSLIFRCEFHSEFFTITRFITVANVDDLPKAVIKLKTSLRLLVQIGSGQERDQRSTELAYAFLYGEIWDALDDHCLGGRQPFGVQDSGEVRVFADFRGLVLRGEDLPGRGTLSLDGVRHGTDQGHQFDKGWPVDNLVPSIWRFLTVETGLDLKRREFTASFMLRRRAVYITALGPQPPAGGGVQCAPLQYFMAARPTSDWQLGALIDRLHFMGTARLAALMELQALRKAGANLRDMVREAEAARKAIEANDIATALDRCQRASELIAHKDRDGRPLFWSGVQFRVERSRYYVTRFDDFVPFLGLDSIEGYQRYDRFVKGRLGGVYDYIDRLGRRQERAAKHVTSISQSILQKELAETNKRIAESNRQSAEANRQSAAAIEQSSLIAQRSMRISHTIEKLQTKAEIALLAVIVPHYAIEIIKEMHAESNENIYRIYLSLWEVGLIFAGVSLFKYISNKREEQPDELNRSLLKYSLVGAIAAATVVFTLYH